VTADRTKITEERTRSGLLTESLLRFPHASHECLGEFGGDLCRRVLEKRANTVNTFNSGFAQFL
jgi:hypothetical protein